MKHVYKYFILYFSFIFITILLIYAVDAYTNKSIQMQKNILLRQAQLYFSSQTQMREWNSRYGGVFVKSHGNIEPNPYLKNAILKVDENLTLIKINPAWMTRQLSKISEDATNKTFHFRITSLEPINPNNKATPFEKKALQYFAKTSSKEYYELHENQFYYMGALTTQKSCMICHDTYKIGDVKGGISIYLDTKEYKTILDSLHTRAKTVKFIGILLLMLVTFLMYKQLKNQDLLEEEVQKQTQELFKTQELVQQVLDADHSFLMVSANQKLILANKSMLHFFDCSTLEEFIEKYSLISNTFESNKDEELLSPFMGEIHWIDYIQHEQNNKEIKVLIKKNAQSRYFKARSKELTLEGEKFYIIIFDEITQELQTIKSLQKKASRDELTQLFNRAKLNEVLSKEISLAQTTHRPLSLIFVDIDFFKIVNDTYGHDVGDEVLVQLANLLLSSIRKDDFLARWGGEEFIITLQSTGVEQAKILAEKIRMRVEEYNFSTAKQQTISLGVTEYIANEKEENFLKRVDEALYKAKRTGRNKVVAL